MIDRLVRAVMALVRLAAAGLAQAEPPDCCAG